MGSLPAIVGLLTLLPRILKDLDDPIGVVQVIYNECAREGVYAYDGHVCLAHVMQKVIYNLRLAFFTGYG